MSATSSGVQFLRNGAFAGIASSNSESPATALADAVFTGPAEIASTRIFDGPTSLDKYRTQASSGLGDFHHVVIRNDSGSNEVGESVRTDPPSVSGAAGTRG